MKNILVVDDLSIMRMATVFPLRRAGYTVFEASSGVSALAYMKQAEPKIDLVITDMNMPGLDGAELIRTIRMLDACKYVPVLAFSTPAYEKEMRVAGATGFIEKGLPDEQLVAVVKKLLRE